MKRNTIIVLAIIAIVFGTIMLADPTSAEPLPEPRGRGGRNGNRRFCNSQTWFCRGNADFQRCCENRWACGAYIHQRHCCKYCT